MQLKSESYVRKVFDTAFFIYLDTFCFVEFEAFLCVFWIHPHPAITVHNAVKGDSSLAILVGFGEDVGNTLGGHT